jgi:hypothetical protein
MTDRSCTQAGAWSFYISGVHGPDSYQGTTSVVPTITAGIWGFSRCGVG